MRFTLLANLAAFALFSLIVTCLGLCRWELLVFQLVVQTLTNEFWTDLFMLPFKGQHLFGMEPGKLADPARVRCVARWSALFMLLFPALVFAALACINHWGDGALGNALHLPLAAPLFLSSLAAQGLLFAATLVGGLVPLSYKTLTEALLARHERRLLAEGSYQPSTATPSATPPPTHAGVDKLPHGLPEGTTLPDCLLTPQCCSPLHARHMEVVRGKLREGEFAILSTAPASVVPLPTSSNERLLGGAGLSLAFMLLYTALGLFEDDTTHLITRWVVLLLGLALLPLSVQILRAASRRQAQLRYTDYFITNHRLHLCRAGTWEAVALVSMEVVPGGMYGEGRGDIDLCPESGSETYRLINVEHAEALTNLLERLIYLENAR